MTYISMAIFADSSTAFPRRSHGLRTPGSKSSPHVESAGLMGGGGLEEIRSIAILIWNQNHLHTRQPLHLLIGDGAVDLGHVGTEQDFDGRAGRRIVCHQD